GWSLLPKVVKRLAVGRRGVTARPREWLEGGSDSVYSAANHASTAAHASRPRRCMLARPRLDGAAMKRFRIGLQATALLLGASVALDAQASSLGQLVADTLHSKALEKNLYGDSPNRALLVYLPASYTTSPAKRYPVIYLLHGFGGTERTWLRFPVKPAMDTLVITGKVREMIVVMPNGNNVFSGSFYTNSST